MLYAAYQALTDAIGPWQQAAAWTSRTLSRGAQQLHPWPAPPGWFDAAAAHEVFSRLRLTHRRPDYGIHAIDPAQPGAIPASADAPGAVAVTEHVIRRSAFGSLLHLRRADLERAGDGGKPLPRVLVVAPLSGHFATLLTDTARTLLADHDVCITDWHNARDVPLSEGPFGLGEYVETVIDFIAAMGPGVHVLAVCQPCVPVLAAAALMAQRDHPAQPRSLTLMAGPIDTRINPTQVNVLATGKPIEWFAQNLVHPVPWRHAGAGREVYPGFLQLTAFMSMNPQRHADAFRKLYDDRRAGDHAAADATAHFYDEYFAVNDLPAEFYLETVEQVFQTHLLARGELVVGGERVDCGAIRRSALFTVEGERDDICAIGQTVAAHDLCTGIKPWLKNHHVQLGVGHYGVFSGRRWRQQIYPRVREMIHAVN
ncbi:polyhydroxyalkanoate depolymerase [Leptothrix discophora]|uniref:Polyhydroxyalkanoate depolymerase n=1 Tax=Leptothrix discophora TaxID=89 RepID=A0ABT9G5U7_LEPDI|nr:polyhydroxyalkanoate depolymerase [Leptothrix discophora]MDP4301785.1 polyhydroxyalkanoate depolymerase [Leptothrix discophora]